MILAEDLLTQTRMWVTQHMLRVDGYGFSGSWFFFIASSMFLAGLAGAMTVYIAPGAAGSGVPEIMSVLNGVDYPGIFSFKVLYVKVIGVVLAVAAGLCIGKEGPLVHIGAIVSLLIMYLPFNYLKQF